MIVIDYKKADKQGVLVGSFTIQYETQFGPRWETLKLFMKNGHRWTGFPNQSFKQPNGTFSYHPLVGFNFKHDDDKWQKACLAALDLFCANTGQEKIERQVCQPLQYKD